MSGSDIINIVFNLGNFYTLTPILRNDEGVKNTVLQNLEKFSPKETKAQEIKEIDPRWEGLKKLLTDKK